jgi:hypothetical protein
LLIEQEDIELFEIDKIDKMPSELFDTAKQLQQNGIFLQNAGFFSIFFLCFKV